MDSLFSRVCTEHSNPLRGFASGTSPDTEGDERDRAPNALSQGRPRKRRSRDQRIPHGPAPQGEVALVAPLTGTDHMHTKQTPNRRTSGTPLQPDQDNSPACISKGPYSARAQAHSGRETTGVPTSTQRQRSTAPGISEPAPTRNHQVQNVRMSDPPTQPSPTTLVTRCNDYYEVAAAACVRVTRTYEALHRRSNQAESRGNR